MNDRTVIAAAVVAASAAFAAVPVPMLVLVVVASSAAGLAAATAAAGADPVRAAALRPLVVASLLCCLAAVVSGRSHAAESALEVPLPQVVDGVARLVTDPERRQFGVTAILSIEGRRYVATVDGGGASVLLARSTGDHVTVTGRPSSLRGAPQGWVLSRHLAGRLSVSRVRPGPPASPPMRVANAARSKVVAGAGSFDDASRPQYLGMVIGDDRGQRPVTEFRFRASGLTHLLVVSGQNVAFVLVVAAPVLAHLPRRVRTVSTIVVIALFVLITRADPSVLRAATMAGIIVLAAASGRLAPSARVLSLAVICLVVVDPLIVHSLGFQLSVAATAGLMVGVARLSERLRGPEPVKVALAATVSAQVATAPLLLSTAGWLSPSAPLTNLLAAPGSALVMMSGATVGVFAGFTDERIASVLQIPARVAVWAVDSVASFGAQLPLAALTPLRTGWLLVWSAAAFVVVASESQHRVRWCVAAAVIAGVALVPAARSPGTYGIADGVSVVEGGCGGAVAVLDHAGDALDVIEALWVFGVRSLDAVVVGGSRHDATVAAAVQEQFGADRLVRPGDPPGLVGALVVGWDAAGQPTVSEPSCTVSP